MTNTETIHKECKTITIQEIHKVCNSIFELEIRAKTRKGDCPEGRACFYYFTKKYFPKTTLTELGKYMNGRNHTTVLYALKKLERTYKNEQWFKAKFERIETILKNRYEKERPKETTETSEQYEIRKLQKLLNDRDMEIASLRKKTDIRFNNEIKRMLAMIPQEKMEMFKTTRLIPFLKMNGNVKV